MHVLGAVLGFWVPTRMHCSRCAAVRWRGSARIQPTCSMDTVMFECMGTGQTRTSESTSESCILDQFEPLVRSARLKDY